MLHCLLIVLAALAPAQVITEAHTGKSGTTVWIITPGPTTPIQKPVQLIRDGAPVTLAPGPMAPSYWSFTLPDGVVLSATDTLALSGPDGWIANATALSIPVRNSVGQCEFPIPVSKTLALGINQWGRCGSDEYWHPVKNWATRLARWGPGVLRVSESGDPVQTKGTAAATRFCAPAWDNGVDGGSLPAPTGLYTLIWDSADPATVLSIRSQDAHFQVIPHPELGSSGDHGVGITRVFEVARGDGLTRNPALQFVVSHPRNTPTYANLWIVPPGNSPDRSDPLAPEQSYFDQISLGTGKGPSTMRFAESVFNINNGNVVDAIDMVAPGLPVGRPCKGGS
jgi:hypothetical protein